MDQNENRLNELREVHSYCIKKQQKLFSYVEGLDGKMANARLERKITKLLTRLAETSTGYALDVNGQDSADFLSIVSNAIGVGGKDTTPLRLYNRLVPVAKVYYDAFSSEEHRLSVLLSAAAAPRH